MKIQIKNKLKLVVGIAVVVFSINGLKAQDGAKLFRQNCTACHKLEGTLVGPGLKGVQAKWQEAGEAENLVKWVQNPAELYNSGTSEMAKLAWEITPIDMTPQALSEADVLAIFEHIEADVVEEKVEEKTELENTSEKKSGKIYTAEEKAQIKKENNNRSRMIFFMLLLTAGCLVAGIVSLSKTIQTFSILKMKKRDEEEDDKKGNGGAIATVIIALIMLAPFSGYSMSFDFEKDGWLFISDADNIILLVVNLVLLFILFDQKKTLKTIIKNYDPTLIPEKEVEEDAAESIVKLLTDTVDIEDEASILMDHEFDGIRELDNNMPPWWVWSFVATVIFAFAYLVHYHVIGTGDLQAVEYQKSVDAAQVEVDAYMSKMAMNVDENNVVVLTDAAALENGKNLYKINCVVCHKDNGEGLVGPNLTDDHWIYGEGDVKTIFTTIKYGTSNGMPEHESKMNPIELQEITSYVMSMEYTEGKAPEGTKIAK
ncbi:MAG: cbb3-type cytochrome c oxidase N-terminal domain-containing protein [Vicingaceae bacterium]|nr:cbb3-type cytochrome c oxidase N-terminal domain-containing protein [Vicingaceae bacterium]